MSADSHAARAEKLLRRLVLDGAFPARARLNELELSQRLGISRSPIREAMQRLSKDWLVRMIPNRSAFVADFETYWYPRSDRMSKRSRLA